MNIYIYSNGWQQLDAIYPSAMTLSVDGSSDSFQVSFTSNKGFMPKPNAPIRCVQNNLRKYFIVKDFTCSTSRDNESQINTITCVEPFEILKDFKLEACSFASNKYTLLDLVQRLCELSRFEYTRLSLPEIEGFMPRLTFNSSTLYQALTELGEHLDMLPYLDFYQNGWEIKFKPLDGTGKEFRNIFQNPKTNANYSGDSLANKVYAELSNIEINAIEPSYIGMQTYATDDSDLIRPKNLGLFLHDPVTKLHELRIYGFNSNNERIYTNPFIIREGEFTYFNKKNEQFTKTIHFVTKEFYSSLTGRGDLPTAADIYIYYENNKIYLYELTFMFYQVTLPNLSVIDNESVHNAQGTILNNGIKDFISVKDEFKDNEYGIRDALYQVLYDTTMDDSIPFFEVNGSREESTTYFNQNSTNLSPDRASRVLKSYIDGMRSGTVLKSGSLALDQEIPMPNDLVDGLVVNSITIQFHKGFYQLDCELVERHARRRIGMMADSDVQLEEIKNEDIVTRCASRLDIVEFSVRSKASVNPFISNPLAANLKEAFFSNAFILDDSTTYIHLGRTKVFQAGNSIVFNEEAESNIVWEFENQYGNMLPYVYSDEQGFNKGTSIQLEYRNPSDENYPNSQPVYLSNSHEIGLKDMFERLSFTYQMLFHSDDFIIREEFVKMILEGVNFSVSTARIELFDRKLSQYENLEGSYTQITTTLQKSENSLILGSLEDEEYLFDYQSWCLYINDVPCLCRNRNYVQTIYISVRDGNPTRTGFND